MSSVPSKSYEKMLAGLDFRPFGGYDSKVPPVYEPFHVYAAGPDKRAHLATYNLMIRLFLKTHPDWMITGLGLRQEIRITKQSDVESGVARVFNEPSKYKTIMTLSDEELFDLFAHAFYTYCEPSKRDVAFCPKNPEDYIHSQTELGSCAKCGVKVYTTSDTNEVFSEDPRRVESFGGTGMDGIVVALLERMNKKTPDEADRVYY